MTSKYSKLSDEILMKKISAMRIQAQGIIDSFKTIQNMNVSDSECELNNIFVQIQNNSSREELEQSCDKLTDMINMLKTKQKTIALAQQKEQQQSNTKSKTDENKSGTGDDDEVEVSYNDVKPKYECITSLETIKRAFFNPTSEEYVSIPFEKQILEHPFVFYKGIYKYSEDMNNKPEYIARNFNKSFVKRMEEYGKYVFAMFLCLKNNDEYKYESYILMNSIGAFEDFMMKDNDDISFEKIDVQTFLEHFKMNSTMNPIFDTLFVH